VLVLAVTGVLLLGVRESTRFNTIMVAVKLGVLALFIVVGVTAFHSANLHPFTPKGIGGISDAGALIFFAGPGRAHHRRSPLRAPDVQAPGRDLAALRHLDGGGAGDLRGLRLPPLAAASPVMACSRIVARP